MSHHYSACQYDEPFKPIRLCNYSPYTNISVVHAMCLPTHCSTTQTIADDLGRMFDHICRGPSSPWGDYATSVWEETVKCCHVSQMRDPAKYCPGVPKKSIYTTVTRRPPSPQEEFESELANSLVTVKAPSVNTAHVDVSKPVESLTPLEKKQLEQLQKKRKREQRKIAQLMRKEEIDLQHYLKRQQIMEKTFRPTKRPDWKTVRHLHLAPPTHKEKIKAKGPVCPSLNACCCDQRPGQWVTCELLRDDMYL